jgi:hypothetical protein
MQRMLGRNEERRDLVPVLEHLLNFAADESTREPSSEKSERKGVFYPIFKRARRGAVRFKRMRVFPVCEWAGHLDIAEKAPLFIVQMFRDPAPSKWPSPEPQHGTRPALDSARPFNDFDVFPRRCEPFQRLRQCVPGIHLGSGGFDS